MQQLPTKKCKSKSQVLSYLMANFPARHAESHLPHFSDLETKICN